jgi:hypothetical protein
VATERGSRGDRPPYAAIAVLSAAALGYEILLMRLFSIIQWHHFAYMMISVALLGYGAAGSFVAVAQHRLKARFAVAFSTSAALFGVSAMLCFLAAQSVAFNPLEILWDTRQPLRLLLIYGMLLVPFFCAATAICLAFTAFPGTVHRLYSFDILGGGVGSLGIVLLLFWLPPLPALRAVASLGLVAAALAWLHAQRGSGLLAAIRNRKRLIAARRPLLHTTIQLLAIVVSGALIWLPGDALRLSPYKGLSQALQVKGARVVDEASSPLGTITVVESPVVPFRHAPGMSLASPSGPPEQLGVFTDGEGFSAINRYEGRRESLAWLDYLTSALPYHLLDRPRVLVLGSGPGGDVLQALYHRARSVQAVELNPDMVRLVEARFPEFSGRPYSAPGVKIDVSEARGFLGRSHEGYDLIQLAPLDAFGAASAGLYALSESYLYTLEAMREYLDHLEPGGILALTRWVTLPPRDVLKLFATVVAALDAEGLADPGSRMMLIRSWSTATLLVKNGVFTAADISRLKAFCAGRSFDVAWYPGMPASEANRYNLLERPEFHEAAGALLGQEREDFLERYKFHIRPAHDDSPYFFRFFKWSTLPELLELRNRGGLPLIEWGYPVLAATLVQALALSLLLILAPLLFLRRNSAIRTRGGGRVAGYFLALGLAFMFVEIAFIQKFILFLSHPVYAVAVVLCAFLVFAGLGSRYSEHLSRLFTGRRAAAIAALVIALIVLLYLAVLPMLFQRFIGLSDPVRIAVSVALIAPLAFAMGMPFPLGLAATAAGAAPLLPWAWGVNGCASVVGAVLAALLAVHFGFNVLVGLALVLYLLAAWSFPSFRQA